MLIFRISQTSNREYDTYSSAIIVASGESEARGIHPQGDLEWNPDRGKWCYTDDPTAASWSNSWVNPDDVEVELVGVAHQPGKRILCASFHAG
jgi:hypothetical protein